VELSGPHAASATELKKRLDAERRGTPFLVLRDADGRQRLVSLGDEKPVLTIGRSAECDVALEWDEQVSRVHAELRRVGPGWTVSDGGLSRNGSFVNGARLTDRRRLSDGDTMCFGRTAVLFRQPRAVVASTTVIAEHLPGPADLSGAQRAVLRALCRPFAENATYARPATNTEIADELVLSVDAIKSHLRVLFSKFGVEGLPQNEKRLRLAERALTSGAVNLAELRSH
jgi:predicted component of type VI protein secretion system